MGKYTNNSKCIPPTHARRAHTSQYLDATNVTESTFSYGDLDGAVCDIHRFALVHGRQNITSIQGLFT